MPPPSMGLVTNPMTRPIQPLPPIFDGSCRIYRDQRMTMHMKFDSKKTIILILILGILLALAVGFGMTFVLSSPPNLSLPVI